MSRKRTRKKLPQPDLSMNRREMGVSPAKLTETSQLATLRILAAALLFAVLAFWGLGKIRRFSEEFILRRELASFRSAVNNAQVFAVQKRQTVRLVLSELESKNVCRFEKLAKNSQHYFDIPLSREDHAFGIDSRNWSPLEPEQHRVFSAVDVSVGPLHTVYMFPNNTCTDYWPLPYLHHGSAIKMKTFPVKFRLGEAVGEVVFTDTGLMTLN
jgi:hypothetical protein